MNNRLEDFVINKLFVIIDNENNKLYEPPDEFQLINSGSLINIFDIVLSKPIKNQIKGSMKIPIKDVNVFKDGNLARECFQKLDSTKFKLLMIERDSLGKYL